MTRMTVGKEMRDATGSKKEDRNNGGKLSRRVKRKGTHNTHTRENTKRMERLRKNKKHQRENISKKTKAECE